VTLPARPPLAAGAPAKTDPAPTSNDAFAQYVLPEVDTLYRVALSLTRHHADAEDLVQDTLLRAHRSIDRFDGRYPRAWLLTILRNTNINRQRRRRPELLRDPDVTLARLEASEPAGGDVEEIVVGRTFDAVVESSLEDLSYRYRRVVELVDIDGLSYEEAAQVLGVPVGTVMSRLHRARRRIRHQLSEAGITPRRNQ
jgi:RNA polymerase sigma-70 factor (ECF subfamily)